MKDTNTPGLLHFVILNVQYIFFQILLLPFEYLYLYLTFL